MNKRRMHRQNRCKSRIRRPLATLVAAFALFSCDPELPKRLPPPKIPPPTVVDASVKKKPVPKPMAKPSMQQAMKPAMEPEKAKTPMRTAKRSSKKKAPCGKFCGMAKDYPKIAPILHRRTTQSRPKMRLTPKQGKDAEGYIIKDLPLMPESRKLRGKMPKTVIELIRSVNERGVTRNDAEEMAEYFTRFLKSMNMIKLGKFDECMSHMVGREWSNVDYSGEPMTWQSQRKFYNRKRPKAMDWVKNIKTKLYLYRFLKMEVRMRYFKMLFHPSGKPPALEPPKRG